MVGVGILLGARCRGAKHQVVLAVKQGEWATRVNIQAMLGRWAAPAPGIQRDAGPGCLIRAAAGSVAELFVEFCAVVGVGSLDLPVIVEAVFQCCEGGQVFPLGVSP